MTTYLLSWNPEKSEQSDFSNEVKALAIEGKSTKFWSVTRSLQPTKGDRFYLIKLGRRGRGVFASGEIISDPVDKPHYNAELAKQGKQLKFVEISFDCLVDGSSHTLINIEELEEINSLAGVNQHWSVENSGIKINDRALVYLDKLWNQKTETLVHVDEASYLNSAAELDNLVESLQRTEQAFLRSQLFRDGKFANCCICGEMLPVQLLVCAHIKKRSKCTEDEKRDFLNIVAPMCRFGCDELFERGYISVHNGIVVDLSTGTLLDKVSAYIKDLVGNRCLSYNAGSKLYFEWHYENNSSYK